MTSSDSGGGGRRDSLLAFSIMFFAAALLCFLLGWANGVRHDTRYLHIPETGGWLVATAVMGGLGIFLLLWSRTTRRS